MKIKNNLKEKKEFTQLNLHGQYRKEEEKMKRNNMNAFTLVELLAVIVILAIILVIAVPKVMSVIEDSKKATLESTAKMIASSAEKQKVQNTVLGNTDAITCDSVAKINKGDYASCSVKFDNNTAKVTIEGKGKFDGLYVCYGTKNNSVATEEECSLCSGNESTVKILNIPKPYEHENGDYDKCFNYLTTQMPSLTEKFAIICNGEGINNKSFSESIDLILNSFLVYFTEEALFENSVIKGDLSIENVCVPNYDKAVTYINNLYNDSNVRSKFGLIKDNTTDQNIRYVGQYPQNYVEFGNTGDLWRIIGIFKVETADGDTEELVKIKSVKGLSATIWDSSSSDVNSGNGVNEWSQADLKTILNTYYIGEEGAQCMECFSGQETCTTDCSNRLTPINSTYRNMIESVVWNTGAIEWNESEITPLQAYNAERGNITGKICSGDYCNDTVERTTKWTGKIGLMYPSDFGYAGGSTCTNIGDSTCGMFNWLSQHNWTITPAAIADDAGSVFLISNGRLYFGNAYSGTVGRPTIYLKSNVKIIDGDGSKENPYKLST